jgi:FkbM family methyltransferase
MRNDAKQIARHIASKAGLRTRHRYERGISLGRDIKRSLPERPSMIFDVGAHNGESLGDFTKWFPRSAVHCFEPGSEAFARLRRRAAANPRVVCSNVALGEETGQATIYIRRATENSSLANYSGQHDLEDVTRTEQIAIDTIDNYADKRGIRRIDFLKVDTEGLDLKVLLGGRAMFDSRSIGMVQVEASMSPENVKHVQCQSFMDFFDHYKYRLFGIYDQVAEWPTDRPFLRRCDLVFISPEIARV